MSNVYYDRVIRKLVIGFGNLFDGINLVRYNPDNTEAERFLVPIAYAAKELYVQRIEGDPNLDKKVQLTLPRMSFEMNGLSYDASRKQATNLKNFNTASSGVVVSQYVPVPYNFDFDLNIYVRNIEDGTQIIEHILPFFTPDYTIKLNLIPEMGIIKEVPIILNQVNSQVTYEGNRDSDTRMVIWTLNFTVKGFIFGASSPPAGIVKNAIVHISNEIGRNDSVVLNAQSGSGTYQQGEIVYQGYSLSTATSTAVVKDWSSRVNQLTLTNVSGTFMLNQPIIGAKTNSNYSFASFDKSGYVPATLVTISTVPNPITANANSNYSYQTTVTETSGITVTTGSGNTANLFIPSAPISDFTYIDLMA